MSRFPVADIRSVDLGTPDLAKSVQFYTTAWGLEVAARQGSSVICGPRAGIIMC